MVMGYQQLQGKYGCLQPQTHSCTFASTEKGYVSIYFVITCAVLFCLFCFILFCFDRLCNYNYTNSFFLSHILFDRCFGSLLRYGAAFVSMIRSDALVRCCVSFDDSIQSNSIRFDSIQWYVKRSLSQLGNRAYTNVLS